MVSAVIPRGRMRGDADGDGAITIADMTLISRWSVGDGKPAQGTEDWYSADVDEDNGITSVDSGKAGQIANGIIPCGQFTEVTGNWTNNPNYATEEEQFFTDIPISGMTAGNPVALLIDSADNVDSEVGFRAESLNGCLRVWAKLVPIAPVNCVVVYSSGTGISSVSGYNNVWSESYRIVLLETAWSEVNGAWRALIPMNGISTWQQNDYNSENNVPRIIVDVRFYVTSGTDLSSYQLRFNHYNNTIRVYSAIKPSETICCDIEVRKSKYNGRIIVS